MKSVFKLKQRYQYRSRPLTPKNFKPRPKSGLRYKRRYTFPSSRPRKSVFRYVGIYKYEPRPGTTKNYCPRPKSSNRYICHREGSSKDIINPYQKRSIFKPKVRYQYIPKQASESKFKYKVIIIIAHHSGVRQTSP